jgi:hypothetical protein
VRARVLRLFRLLCVVALPGCGNTPALQECEQGSWDDDGDAATACRAWSACSAGTSVTTQGDGTHDRTCSACPAGTFGAGTNGAACLPWTNCGAGQFVLTEGTASADRYCSACPIGMFNAEINATACRAPTDCVAGERVAAEFTDALDRVCSPCPVGTFSTTRNAAACTAWTACAAGQVVVTAGTTTTDQICSACPAGSFSAPGSGGSCTNWSTCSAGQFVSAAGSATSDRVCAACPAGSFSAQSNAASCSAWTTCAPGTVVTSAGTATTDRACTPCASSTFSTQANSSACSAWSVCGPGQYVTDAGTQGSDYGCAPCASATFSTQTYAQSCSGWSSCAAGQYVADAGSATGDRVCSTCGAGTFSTQSNAGACALWTSCVAGQFVADAGTSTADRECAACASGTFSTQSNVASCSAWTSCVAGQFVADAGSTTTDRFCLACDAGTFSTQLNASACAAWTACPPGDVQSDAGSATTDRLCAPTEWTRQFGTSGTDSPASVAVDDAGYAVVVGSTSGAFPGQTSSGANDAFVTLHDPSGAIVWARQFGSPVYDGAYGVSIGEGRSIFVTGGTYGALPGQVFAGGQSDAFVRKYSASGTELWTREFGTADGDWAFGAASDPAGNFYVTGYFGAGTSAAVAFVRKYDRDGNALWTRQFGSSAGTYGYGVAVAGDGSIVVAGITFGALPSQTGLGDSDAFVRKYDAAGVELWTRQFGTAVSDQGLAVAVDAAGNIALVGTSQGALPGQTNAGSSDAIVAYFDSAGTMVWLREYGGASQDSLFAVAFDSAGAVIVSGGSVYALPGQTWQGSTDAVVRKYSASGAEIWTHQFGTAFFDFGYGVAVDPRGLVYVCGATDAALPGQTALGSTDGFLRRYLP